jgi:mannan endo-1,4-beta-mannosidase
MPQYVDWADEASSHDDFYTDDQIREWFKNHISTVLNRQNTVTGVKYKNDPTIAMWELANEPRARWYNRPDMIKWIGDIASHIKSIDPNHLVSTGMGGGAVIEVPEHYREANKKDAIDVYSIHVWTDPRHQDKGTEGGNRMIRNHTETAHDQLNMPIYSGEFGWPVDRTDGTDDTQEVLERNNVLSEWFDVLDEHGTNGGLVWDLRFDQEYSSVSEWNYYAVFPRDTDTPSVIRDAAMVFAGKSGDVPSGLQSVSGNRLPKDHDGDGLYEDVYGTGRSSILDVQLLFNNLESTAVQNNAAAFDFSDTGGDVTILDVQALFNNLE